MLGGRDIAVVRLVHRDQGLIVAPGNPLGIAGIEDLPARPALRQPPARRGDARAARPRAGTAAASRPRGRRATRREEHTHLAVAAAVAAGRADAGLGVLAAARAFALDFVPVTREPYDLCSPPRRSRTPVTAPLWALLEDPAFRTAVEALGGYATAEMGRRIR